MDVTGAPIRCQACENRPGRGIKLFGGRIKLNAATDDFVFFGYFQSLGRIFPVLTLTIVLLVLQDQYRQYIPMKASTPIRPHRRYNSNTNFLRPQI